MRRFALVVGVGACTSLFVWAGGVTSGALAGPSGDAPADAGDAGAEAEAEAEDELDPLAELAALGEAVAETGPEGGGSIRAKRDADTAYLTRIKDPRNVQAKVEEVKLGRFPVVAVRVRVLKPAREGAGKSLARNAKLVLLPKLKVSGGRVDMRDADTLINAGSYYLQRGDKIMVRVGAKRGALWDADYIERK